jgi:hypothetical protein
MKVSRKVQAKACLGALGVMALAVSMTACGSASAADPGGAVETEGQVDHLSPLVATTLDAPIPVRGSDGMTHVVYELEVRNASPREATITKVETIDPTRHVLHTLEGPELLERIVSIYPAIPSESDDPSAIATVGPGRTVMLVMDGTYPSRDAVPDQFTHRFTSTLSPADPTNRLSRLYGSVTERTGDVTLGEGEPVLLAPPLAGDHWVVGNGCCAASPHRRTVLPVDGHLSPFERFAIDWMRVNPSLDPATLPLPWMLPTITEGADVTSNDSYLAYDEPLLAVADGTVVAVVDGRADTTPQTEFDYRTLDEIGGNYLILDIGDGFYAFYAHVKSGTFEVEVGDRVEEGEVIGRLGNSGNSTEAHLHFHVGRQPTPFMVTNWPYEFTSFDVTGALDPEDKSVTDTPTSGSKTSTLPLQWDIVTFPG